MSKLNLLFFLNSHRDDQFTNSPSRSSFNWSREIRGIDAEDPKGEEFSLSSGESNTLFNGSRSLSHDGTTEYDISLDSGNTYILEKSAGTSPAFRTARTTGADATTEVDITKSGDVVTIASSGGTAFDFVSGGVVVGDEIRVGSGFLTPNQGKFTVLAVTATSISFENASGQSETGVVLGADFASDVMVYSASGVQVGDKVRISGGFSLFTQGSYEILDVYPDRIDFNSGSSLPSESGIQTNSIDIYSDAKQFIYLESWGRSTVTINGTETVELETFVVGGRVKPGVLALTSTVWQLDVKNNENGNTDFFLASAE